MSPDPIMFPEAVAKARRSTEKAEGGSGTSGALLTAMADAKHELMNRTTSAGIFLGSLEDVGKTTVERVTGR